MLGFVLFFLAFVRNDPNTSVSSSSDKTNGSMSLNADHSQKIARNEEKKKKRYIEENSE